MPDRDRAAVDVDAGRIEAELAHRRHDLARKRLVELDQVEIADAQTGSRKHLAHCGDRTDSHHAGLDARDRAREHTGAHGQTVCARIGLLGDHERRRAVIQPRRVAGADRPTLAERGAKLREPLDRRLGPGVLIALDELAAPSRRDLDGDELLGKPSSCVGRRPTLLRLERPRILLGPRDAVPLGDVLARLAHRLGAVPLAQPRVGKAPADRRVLQRLLATREGGLGLAEHERRARHRLDAAGDEDVARAGDDRVGRGGDRLQPRGAEAVDREPADLDREPREQRRHAPDVAVVLTRLVGRTEHDVLDRRGIDPGAAHGLGDDDRREVIWPHRREHAAVAADGRPARRDDHGPPGGRGRHPRTVRRRVASPSATLRRR